MKREDNKGGDARGSRGGIIIILMNGYKNRRTANKIQKYKRRLKRRWEENQEEVKEKWRIEERGQSESEQMEKKRGQRRPKRKGDEKWIKLRRIGDSVYLKKPSKHKAKPCSLLSISLCSNKHHHCCCLHQSCCVNTSWGVPDLSNILP